MKDPLAGHREAINRAQTTVLTYPADKPCPLQVGMVFQLRACRVEIRQEPVRRIMKGRAEWHCPLAVIWPDRVYIPRASYSAPPVTSADYDSTGQVPPPGANEIDKGRDGNYTSSVHMGLPDEPEGVSPHEVASTEFQIRATKRDDDERAKRARDFDALPLAEKLRRVAGDPTSLADRRVRSEIRQLERTVNTAARKLGIAA